MRFTCTGCGLSDALWAKYAAIYGTFVIEASAIIFLAIPRLHCGRRP